HPKMKTGMFRKQPVDCRSGGLEEGYSCWFVMGGHRVCPFSRWEPASPLRSESGCGLSKGTIDFEPGETRFTSFCCWSWLPAGDHDRLGYQPARRPLSKLFPQLLTIIPTRSTPCTWPQPAGDCQSLSP